mgnify:CR=1 FL=1
MRTLKDRVEECERRFPLISRADVARAAGVKQPSVTDWFNGKTNRLKLKPAVGEARLWRCDPLWLGEGDGLPNWRSADSEMPTAAAAALPSVADALTIIAGAIKDLPRAHRQALVSQFTALALAPDSADLLEDLIAALSPSTALIRASVEVSNCRTAA